MQMRSFYIGKTNYHKGLFYQLRGKEAAPNRVPDGSINMVNEISTNNGISKKGYSDHVFRAPAITVSVNYAQNVFMQDEDFCASVNILVLKSDWLDKYPGAGLYIATILKKINFKYSYTVKISKDKLNDSEIILPIKTDKKNKPIIDKNNQYHEEGYIPDWDYMAERIAELEQERIAELDNYLKVTGLNDYELTDRDKEVLCMISGKNPEDYDKAEQCDSKCQEVA